MKKRYFLCVLFVCVIIQLQAQNTWTPVAAYPANVTITATSVVAGGKAYVTNTLGGSNNTLYEFDPAANTWTQKTTLTSSGFGSKSVGFAINNIVYFGTGASSGFASSAFYAYDPVTDTWTQKASIPAGRGAAIAFSIGNKGYIGTGFDANTNYLSDFYEYDPITDTWTQKASFPGPRAEAGSFVIGSKGYVVGGRSSFSTYHNDLWEYDPATDTWTQKAAFPGSPRIRPVGFAIGGSGFAGTGYDGTSTNADFYEYSPATNTWMQRASYGGGNRHWATSFAINNKGYIGLGLASGSGSTGTMWEYTPLAGTVANPAVVEADRLLLEVLGRDQVNIRLMEEAARLNIYSLTGQRLYSQPLSFRTGEFLVGLPELSGGMYLLRLETVSGSAVLTRKFVSQ